MVCCWSGKIGVGFEYWWCVWVCLWYDLWWVEGKLLVVCDVRVICCFWSENEK